MIIYEKKKQFISVIVYVNDSPTIIDFFIQRLTTQLSEKFENYEIIIVDDRGIHGIEEVIERGAVTVGGKIVLVQMAYEHGRETALLAGVELSMGDFVYEIETISEDYPLEILYELFVKALEGSDIVAAIPERGSIPIASRLFYSLMKRASHLKLDLSTERIRLVSRRAVNAILKSREKVRYRKVLYKYLGFNYATITYKPKKILKSQRKNKMNLAVEVFLTFSDLGVKISFVAALLFFIVSVGLGAYSLVAYVTFEFVVTGWTTIMLFLSFGFSGLFLILGLMGKYMNMILVEVKNRPLYATRSIKYFN